MNHDNNIFKGTNLIPITEENKEECKDQNPENATSDDKDHPLLIKNVSLGILNKNGSENSNEEQKTIEINKRTFIKQEMPLNTIGFINDIKNFPTNQKITKPRHPAKRRASARLDIVPLTKKISSTNQLQYNGNIQRTSFGENPTKDNVTYRNITKPQFPNGPKSIKSSRTLTNRQNLLPDHHFKFFRDTGSK